MQDLVACDKSPVLSYFTINGTDLPIQKKTQFYLKNNFEEDVVSKAALYLHKRTVRLTIYHINLEILSWKC